MFPRKVGTAWEIFAPAKLNLYLEVLGPRADGFHALETLMVPVRIYDQLVYTPAARAPVTLRVRSLIGGSDQSNQPIGRDDDNLVMRAVRLLSLETGVSPHGRFDLIKRIPIQAGMGGGSSDAAAALLLANAAWGLGLTRQQLMPLAAQLGSDVPFFIDAHAAICRGRGELVEPVERLPRLHFVIAKPTGGLSTAEVFGRLRSREENGEELANASRRCMSELVSSLQSGAVASACCRMTNRLETAAAPIAPWLVKLREAFSQIGCVGQFMTGSGSAYVGVMRSATQAQRAERRLAGMKIGNVFATSSC